MVYVKICGNTNVDDALCAAEAGADLLGFILYPKSPRGVSVETTTTIVRELRIRSADGRWRMPLCVGVFVNEDAATIARTTLHVGLDAAQINGVGPAFDLSALGVNAYRAINGVDQFTYQSISAVNRSPGLPSLMIDADHPTLFGGTGMRADENESKDLARKFDLLLAGGLTPENVFDAIRAVNPWGVDVASGTEQSPGIKDHAKVRAFIAAAKRSGSAQHGSRR